MKIVVQRVNWGKVTVDNKLIAQIKAGYVVLLGVKKGDEEKTADILVQKLLNLRIMPDENNKMNLSIQDIKGEILVVSQFTLYAETSGRRPGFTQGAMPQEAKKLCDYFVEQLKKSGLRILSGEFGAYMQVDLCNDGPVTIIMES